MSWRDVLKIHPACELFPPLPPDELKALGEDIKTNHLQQRAKVIRDGDKYALIDGRSRLDAIEAVGLTIKVFEGSSPNNKFFEVVDPDTDPFDYVMSMNARRRHMTGEQKRDVAAKLLQRFPERSNLAIAKMVGVSHPTVATVRAELEEAGDVEKFSTRTDSAGRQQPAHRPKPSTPPSDAPTTAGKVRDQFEDAGDVSTVRQEMEGRSEIRTSETRTDDAVTAALERELAAARVRIRQLEERVEELEEMAVQKADKIRALQAALKEKNQSAATPGAPSGFQMEAGIGAGVVPSPSFYEAALKTIETFEGSASQLLDWWRSKAKDRAKLALEDQTRLSQLYTAKFNSLPLHEGGTS